MTINWEGLEAYILARLSEKTTWAGITGLFTAAGVTIKPDLATQIGSAGAAIASVFLILHATTSPTTITTTTTVVTTTPAA